MHSYALWNLVGIDEELEENHHGMLCLPALDPSICKPNTSTTAMDATKDVISSTSFLLAPHSSAHCLPLAPPASPLSPLRPVSSDPLLSVSAVLVPLRRTSARSKAIHMGSFRCNLRDVSLPLGRTIAATNPVSLP